MHGNYLAGVKRPSSEIPACEGNQDGWHRCPEPSSQLDEPVVTQVHQASSESFHTGL